MTNIFPPAIYNGFAGGIFIVIYLDILFVINFFVTFFLLQATAKLTKKCAKVGRLLLSSAVGAFYSFIILADISAVIIVASKLVAAGVILFAAFRFDGVKSYLSVYFIFFVMNYAFLGVVYGIALLFKTPYIYLSNSTVYLNISARGLLISAFVAYLISCLVVRLYNRKLASNTTYRVTVENAGHSVELTAFSDTGNRLREPFSDYPVIIAEKEKVQALVLPEQTRVIPASTVTGQSFLIAFKPERVTLKTERGEETIENIYIAMSDEVGRDSFSAVLNPEILSV